MTAWRAAAFAALLTIVVGFAFPAIPGIGACGASGSWVAFQMVSSVSAVNAMIRPDCADVLVPALRWSMWLDNLVFVPVYGTFLGLAFFALRPLSRAAWIAGIASLAIGIVADQIEGFRLLAILDALPGTQAMIESANAATLAKKLGLSGMTLMIGLHLIGERNAVRLLGAGVALGGLAVMLSSFGSPFGEQGQMINQFGLLIAWLALAIVSGIKGFWPVRA